MNDYKAINKLLNAINHRIQDETEQRVVCTISTISSSVNNAYLTPIRQISDIVIFGVVIATLEELKLILSKICSKSVCVFIDLDAKKIKGTDCSIIEEVSKMSNCTNILGYKPNDITTYSSWQYLTNEHNTWRKCIFIAGAGNIGSKLALMLAESGSRVLITRRDHHKGRMVASSLNIISNKKGSVSYIEDFSFESQDYPDVIVGASNGNVVLELKHVYNAKPNTVMIELGKGTFSKESILEIRKQGISFYRVDISDFLVGFISAALSLKKTIKEKFGIKNLTSLNIISGGYMGQEGDVIVDSINDPNQVIGISDGMGGRISDSCLDTEMLLKKIKLEFESE